MTTVLTILAALGSGLIAGLFFAFSVSVMGAFERLPAGEGMAAMQMINVEIINPVFFAAFFGTALTCIVVAVLAVADWQAPRSAWLLAGAALYLVGSIGITILFNVPLNNALAAAVAGSAEGTAVWSHYLSTWTAWNHARTVASLLATAAFILASR